MTFHWDAFTPIATTVLYEGHLLYPYRPTALKNRPGWQFGTLFPPGVAGEPCGCVLEIAIESAATPEGAVRICCLGTSGETWVERPLQPAAAELFDMGEGRVSIAVGLAGLGEPLWKLRIACSNVTPAPPEALRGREEAAPYALAAVHLRCGLARGAFVSAQDPGPRAAAAAACRCEGLYPVLVGEPGERRYLLAAPIILEDYPRIARESRGDFCDATEMDELLTLRVMTLTDGEKQEVWRAGGAGRRILERCGGLDAALPEELTDLHGIATAQPPATVRCGTARLRTGSAVRLHPRPGGDLYDMFLQNKSARVQAIEQDLEGNIQLAVVLDDDPGRDLGEMRQSGHRFFFSLSEVEPL